MAPSNPAEAGAPAPPVLVNELSTLRRYATRQTEIKVGHPVASSAVDQPDSEAINIVARNCGSLAMECSDVSGYVAGVSDRITDESQDARFARGGDHPPARRSGPRRRFDRRGARARRAGARQTGRGPRRDRGHDQDLHRPDRTGRPARRPHGRLRRGDEPGPERLEQHREHRQQDQHARAQRHDRGGARRRGGALVRGRRRRGQEARARHARRDQPDRLDPGVADPRGRAGHLRDQDRRRPQPDRAEPLHDDEREYPRRVRHRRDGRPPDRRHRPIDQPDPAQRRQREGRAQLVRRRRARRMAASSTKRSSGSSGSNCCRTTCSTGSRAAACASTTPPSSSARRRSTRELTAIIEGAIARGEISEDAVFDTHYVAMAGTDPVQYSTRFCDFADAHVRPVLDRVSPPIRAISAA